MIINGKEHWTIRPPTKPIPAAARTDPNFTNLSGRLFGTFEVVGFLGAKGAQTTVRWLVRCMCGEFECRTSKAIKNEASERDECIRCTHRRKTERRAA